MRKVQLKLNTRSQEMVDTNDNEYTCADYKDVAGLLEGINSFLDEYNLELIEGDAGDDSIWVTVAKTEEYQDELERYKTQAARRKSLTNTQVESKTFKYILEAAAKEITKNQNKTQRDIWAIKMIELLRS